MTALKYMMNYAATFALKVAEQALYKEPAKRNPFEGLEAVESTSILGKHNGVVDDDLLDSLVPDYEAA